jgi:hypothetical protein
MEKREATRVGLTFDAAWLLHCEFSQVKTGHQKTKTLLFGCVIVLRTLTRGSA